MSELPILQEGENLLVELVPTDPRQYVRNRNRVAAITDRHLIFLKKRVFGAYYEIVYVALDDVLEIANGRSFAFAPMLGGLILVSTSAAVIILALLGQLTGPGVIFFPLTFGSLGVSLVFGLRRRRLTFRCKNGVYRWLSAPLRYRESAALVNRVRDVFAPRAVALHGFESA